MRHRIIKALLPACAFGAAMASITAARVIGLSVQGHFRIAMVLWPLVAFLGWTALALPLVACNAGKPDRGPLDMSPLVGWLLGGGLAAFVLGAGLARDHVLLTAIVAAAAWMAAVITFSFLRQSR